LLAIGWILVKESGESLTWPVNAVSGVWTARCDDGELLSTAYIAGSMHGHSSCAKCIYDSIALAALMVCLQTASTVPFAHGLFDVVKW
jgi:hypothetical protein